MCRLIGHILRLPIWDPMVHDILRADGMTPKTSAIADQVGLELIGSLKHIGMPLVYSEGGCAWESTH